MTTDTFTGAGGPPPLPDYDPIRCNNPLNIRWYPGGGSDWNGLVERNYQAGEFCRYKLPWHGWRAGWKTADYHQRNTPAADGSRCDTVTELLHIWAPPIENDTGEYIRYVLDRMDIQAGHTIYMRNWNTAKQLLLAMSEIETGKRDCFGANTVACLEKGMFEGGCPQPGKHVVDPAAKSTSAAGRSGGIAGLAAGATAAPFLPALADLSPFTGFATRALEIAPWAVGIAVAGVALYFLCRRIFRSNTLGL